MKHLKKITLTVLILGLMVIPAMASTDQDTVMVPASFSKLAEKAKPGVVNIQTEKIIKGGGRVYRHFFGSHEFIA